MKAHRITYTVDGEKTSFLEVNEDEKVSDVIQKIRANEKDDEYQYLYYREQKLDKDSLFNEHKNTTSSIYIATKAEKSPEDLSKYQIDKSDSDDDAPTINEDDVIDFKIPEPIAPEPEILKKKDHNVSNPVRKKFRIYTSLTLNSMLKGHAIDGIDKDMPVEQVNSIILNWIKNEETFKEIIRDPKNIEVHLFLPRGVPFLSGTFDEYESCFDTFLRKELYVVVTRELHEIAKKTYKQVCNCNNDEMKLLLSPLYDSTPEGYTQIASLLGYFYYGGSLPTSENLLRNLATMTGFAPLIDSLYTIMVQKKVTGLMIASITAPLQTFISEKVIESSFETAFSYTISFMSYVNRTKIKRLPVPNLITYEISNYDDEMELNDVQKYFIDHKYLNYIVLWDKTGFKVSDRPDPVKINQLNENYKSEMSLKPFSPMTIQYLYSVSFIRLTKVSDSIAIKVGLFIRKKPTKEDERNVLFINPEVDCDPDEIDYEELAYRIGDNSIDENVKSCGDHSLKQIIFFCFDTSLSMKNLLNGKCKRGRDKEPSRNKLSTRFLQSLMKRVHDLKVPTAKGLILFGKEIEIKCPLSIAERDFNKAIENIEVSGTTPLWNAVDLAADEIIKFNPSVVINGETKYKYPDAQKRIILISDANDTESNTSDAFAITDKLLKNRIVMDVIMISTVEECRDALVVSKITGGLSFKPENEEQGIEIFENEAFLNILARNDYKPIRRQVTEELFNQVNEDIGINPYTDSNNIVNKFIKDANSKAELSSVAYTLYFRKDEKYQPKTLCDRYILKQLNRIKRTKDTGILVYVFHRNLRRWRVFLKGPDNTPYANVWWNLFIRFPTNYPNSPPQFRFISIPYHQNVSSEGVLLFNRIGDGYDPCDKMLSILKSIKVLLKKPDDSCCLRENLKDERINNIEVFNRKVIESVNAIGDNNYSSFIEGIKINEDIPEDGIIDDEFVDESLFISVTSLNGTFNLNEKSDDFRE